MNRKPMLVALAVSLMWPAALTAQDTRTRTRTRPRVRVDAPGPRPFGGAFAFADNRGRIGVVVDTRANASGDKIGARIEGITPGGPAEKAGLKAGDVVTRFNTTALGGLDAEDDEDSGPGMKLIELARALEPGDTVQIEYRRGNDTRRVTLVAADLGSDLIRTFPDMERIEGMMPRVHVGPGNRFEFAFGGPWSGIELVKLNPDLGDYFGAREGVLVVSAPEDTALALKGGDVITAIGGRKPTSPTQAMRILRSYDPGETVAIEVLRKRQRVTVNYNVPEDDDHFYKVAPRMREEPSWFRLRPKIAVPVWKVRDVIRMRAI